MDRRSNSFYRMRNRKFRLDLVVFVQQNARRLGPRVFMQAFLKRFSELVTAGRAGTLHLSHSFTGKPLHVASGSCRRRTGLVVDFDPASAQMAPSLRRHINHMRVFLGRRRGIVRGVLTGQFEIQLGRFV